MALTCVPTVCQALFPVLRAHHFIPPWEEALSSHLTDCETTLWPLVAQLIRTWAGI